MRPQNPISRARESAVAYAVEPSNSAREIPAGKFKAQCLALMDELNERGGEYVITKRGVPVARLLPAHPIEHRPLLGSMKGTVKVRGDIVSPLEEPWDALRQWDDE